MTDIEGTKDYYQHLLGALKAILFDELWSFKDSEDVEELINKIDKCLKDYGVDWKLDEEEDKND